MRYLRNRRFLRYVTRDRAAFALALAAPVAVAAILLPLRAHWPNTNVALILVVVVVGVAVIGNRVAGALAAVWAALWFDFFFTVPYDRFSIRSSTDVTTFVLLLVVGVAVSQLAARARQLRILAITDDGYLRLVHETAALTQSARSGDAVVEHVREQLISVLGLERCRFEYGSLVGRPPRVDQDGSVIAGRAGLGRLDVERSGFPPGEVELRTFGNGQYYGRFMMTAKPGSRPSLQARLVAVTLANQVGRALASPATRAPRAPR